MQTFNCMLFITNGFGPINETFKLVKHHIMHVIEMGPTQKRYVQLCLIFVYIMCVLVCAKTSKQLHLAWFYTQCVEYIK